MSGPAASLPPDLRLGPVHLTVSDLARSVSFYERSLGLELHGREDGTARVGTGGEDLLVLHERPGARAPGRHAGLYHFALLVPSREDLARALRRLVDTRTPLQGASDHLVSEALYLPDPDGLGIEVYADRPRDAWRWDDGVLRMDTLPLDLRGLLAAAPDDEPPAAAAPGTRVGHVHLHVSRLEPAVAFYRDEVGFDPTTMLAGSAAFLSAGGYHHHLGVNTWRGVGVPPAPDDVAGLRHWTVVLPDRAWVAAVEARLAAGVREPEARPDGALARDPSGNAVLFTAEDAARR